MSKVTGKLIGHTHGLTITAYPVTPKTAHGKERIWIQIRQNEGKKWRVYETLAYARSLDVQFVAEPE